jgi:Peptidase family S41
MKHFVGPTLAILGFLSGIQARSITKPTAISLPSSKPIAAKFSSWLSAFNTGNETMLLDFYSSSFPERNASQEDEICWAKGIVSPTHLARMANWTGGFDLVDLEPSPDDYTITVLLQDKGRFGSPGYFRAVMAIDEEKPGQPITKMNFWSIPTPLKMIPMDNPNREQYEKGLQPLTSELRTKLIQNIVNVLGEQYMNTKEAEKRIAILETNLREGVYDAIVDSSEFHMRLNADIRDASSEIRDRIHIRYGPPYSQSVGKTGKWKKGAKKVDFTAFYEEHGYGFGNVSFDAEAIPGKTIATVPITALFGLDQPGVLNAARAVMNSASSGDILILDLRGCVGMSPETAAFVLSYLFDEPRPLTKLLDRGGKVQNFTATMDPEEMKRMGSTIFGGKKPVYVLTSRRTLIEAEMIAYSVQKYGRGIVVGEEETTGGWAHPTEVRVGLCEEEFGDGWWGMYVRTRRLVHAATGWSWEEVGVTSDVVVEETAIEEHCRHKARLAAIEFERNKGIERQDELKV